MRALLAGWVLFAPLAAMADPVPGQHEEAFEQAVTLWLADEEADALLVLSDLAQQGNAAAQLLLALIDKSPALQGPWLAQLPRAARIELMRMPGGLSGRSWIHDAAEQSPLAALWLRLWSADAPAALALDFAAQGETRAAREALIYADKRAAGGMAALVDHPDYPPSLRFLAWQDGAEIDGDDLAPGDPQRRIMGLELGPDDVVDWLATAPEALPARQFCDTRCAASVRSCTLAATQAMGSHSIMLTFGSPSERLIDAARFAASDRGQSALLRRAALTTDARGRRHLLAQAEATDPCFAAQLQEEIERYRAPLITAPVVPSMD